MATRLGGKEIQKQRRYELLVVAHSAWLHRYAYWIAGNTQDAEDLVQETFLRAWRFLDGLKDSGAAKSWLTTILRRENARKFERKRLDYSDVEIDSVADDQTDFDPRPESSALRLALKQLPAMYRETLILQVLGGYSMQEIAKICDIPSNTAATRLHRARLKLREVLAESAPSNLAGNGA